MRIWNLLRDLFFAFFPLRCLWHRKGKSKEEKQYALIMEKQQELFRLREWLDRAYVSYPNASKKENVEKRMIALKSGHLEEVEKRRYEILLGLQKMYAERRDMTELAARTRISEYENRELKTEVEKEVYAFKRMQSELVSINDWLDNTYAYLYHAGTREVYLGPECRGGRDCKICTC